MIYNDMSFQMIPEKLQPDLLGLFYANCDCSGCSIVCLHVAFVSLYTLTQKGRPCQALPR